MAEKKKAAKAKSKAAASVIEAAMPMGMPKPMTDRQVVKASARSAKVRATQDWIDGRMDSDEHENVHKRANHVLSGKDPGGFKGKTGEKKPKKGSAPW